MKRISSSILLLSALCGSLAMAQHRGGGPRPFPPGPVAPLPGPMMGSQDILFREDSVYEMIRSQSFGLSRLDITNQVRRSSRSAIVSSLTVHASSERGRGVVRLVVDGRLLGSMNAGIKRTSQQFDVDLEVSRIGSVILETEGNILIEGLLVASSNQFLGAAPIAPPPAPPGPIAPPPGPVVPPPGVIPACELSGETVVNGVSYGYAGGYDGRILVTAWSLDEALAGLDRLAASRLCEKVPRQLRVLGPGRTLSSGVSMAHRLGIDFSGRAIIQTNNVEEALRQVDQLRLRGVAFVVRERCDLTRGLFGDSGIQFNSIVLVGGAPLVAYHTTNDGLNMINRLRSIGMCL